MSACPDLACRIPGLVPKGSTATSRRSSRILREGLKAACKERRNLSPAFHNRHGELRGEGEGHGAYSSCTIANDAGHDGAAARGAVKTFVRKVGRGSPTK